MAIPCTQRSLRLQTVSKPVADVEPAERVSSWAAPVAVGLCSSDAAAVGALRSVPDGSACPAEALLAALILSNRPVIAIQVPAPPESYVLTLRVLRMLPQLKLYPRMPATSLDPTFQHQNLALLQR